MQKYEICNTLQNQFKPVHVIIPALVSERKLFFGIQLPITRSKSFLRLFEKIYSKHRISN